MNRLLQSLADVCAAHQLEEKILIVPSRVVGRQITDALAANNHPWINLRAETIASLAHRVAGDGIAREGKQTLSRARMLAVVEKACHETLGSGSYFGSLKDSPGFHRVLSRTITELRASGIDAATLSPDTLDNPQKALDLKKILAAFEEILREQNLIDGAGVRRRAAGLLEEEKANRVEAWLLLPQNPPISGAERHFLDLLARHPVRELAVDDPLAWKNGETGVSYFRAAGEENEIREIFRRAIAGKIPFDQIEVLYTDRETYLPLAYELSREYGVPATFVDRIRVTFTRPGRAVLGYLDWLAGGLADDDLRRLITGGFLDLEKLSGSARLTPRAAARILQDAGIGWGRERYLPRLDASEKEAADEGAREEIRGVKKIAENLLAIAPQTDGRGKLRLGDLADSCRRLIENYASSSSELDGTALVVLPSIISDLAFLQEEAVGLGDAIRRIHEAVSELYVGGSEVTYPRPGHLHFAGYQDGGYTGRPHTFLVGFGESRFPGAGLQDPVLLDGERRRVNETVAPREVPLRGDALQQNLTALRATLARLRGAITLSYSCYNPLEDREEFPAGFFLEASSSVSVGNPAGFIASSPAKVLVPSQWWLSRIEESGLPPEGAAGSVLAEYPWLARGREARQARESREFTIYDGRIEGAGSEFDPRTTGEAVSASRLETMADCPFRYFLQYLLEIRPPEDLARREGVWLDPAQMGTLLHAVFRNFMEEKRGTGKTPTVAGDGKRLEEIADTVIAQWRAKIPPPNEPVFVQQRAAILTSCRTFLRSEEEIAGSVTPVGFEIAFGGESGHPVEISLGEARRLSLRGKIDRVDRRPDGTFEVWDYKTGSSGSYQTERRLNDGRRLQHALYAAAYEALCRQQGAPGGVAAAGYAFVGPRESGQRVEFEIDLAKLRVVLDDLCGQIREGRFLHATEKARCAFCPYEEICGGRAFAADRAKEKLEAGR